MTKQEAKQPADASARRLKRPSGEPLSAPAQLGFEADRIGISEDVPSHRTNLRLRRKAVLRMQQRHGNAFVQRRMADGSMRSGRRPKLSGSQGSTRISERATGQTLLLQRQADVPTYDELQGKVNTVKGLAGNLKKAGETLMGKEQPSAYIAGSNLITAADDLLKAAMIYDEFRGDLQGLPLEEVSKRLGKADKALKALDLISRLTDNEAYEAFLKDPTSKNAEKFVDDVGDTFDSAAQMVPPNIPFVSDMLKGYLSAPANYLKAFSSALYAHINKLDKYADISKERMRLTHGNETLWRGELSRVAQRVYASGDREMWDLMVTYRLLLENVSESTGLAYLMRMVGQRTSWDRREYWMRFLGRQLRGY